MTTLLVGFDSAWTSHNKGAVVAVLQGCDATLQDLGEPQMADFRQAEEIIQKWRYELVPAKTLILLDQPTIVNNGAGQRPVENIVASLVGRRRGGMQPANTGRVEMFGECAPIWGFLDRFGGAADPLKPNSKVQQVVETYPVLTMIALNWMLPDSRASGRLAKYNPMRRKTFSISDWRHVCEQTSAVFRELGLVDIVRWINQAGQMSWPRKQDQDGLDACLCLLVAIWLATQKDCLMVGDQQSGYIVVPYVAKIHRELTDRCIKTGQVPSQWVRKLPAGGD